MVCQTSEWQALKRSFKKKTKPEALKPLGQAPEGDEPVPATAGSTSSMPPPSRLTPSAEVLAQGF